MNCKPGVRFGERDNWRPDVTRSSPSKLIADDGFTRHLPRTQLGGREIAVGQAKERYPRGCIETFLPELLESGSCILQALFDGRLTGAWWS